MSAPEDPRALIAAIVARGRAHALIEAADAGDEDEFTAACVELFADPEPVAAIAAVVRELTEYPATRSTFERPGLAVKVLLRDLAAYAAAAAQVSTIDALEDQLAATPDDTEEDPGCPS